MISNFRKGDKVKLILPNKTEINQYYPTWKVETFDKIEYTTNTEFEVLGTYSRFITIKVLLKEKASPILSTGEDNPNEYELKEQHITVQHEHIIKTNSRLYLLKKKLIK